MHVLMLAQGPHPTVIKHRHGSKPTKLFSAKSLFFPFSIAALEVFTHLYARRMVPRDMVSCPLPPRFTMRGPP